MLLSAVEWAGGADVAPRIDVSIATPQPNFKLPEGFTIERIAGPPLVDRPISCDFDERGRMYVSDSSGSNEDVEKVQVINPTHKIRRLEDVDGDGIFDKSTVFADKLMFPEGTLWYDGSLYVAAPPSIWKLTDTDDDGVADRREEWFQAGTLTHCANDLHGPYLGPDGWFYWCKGAYAEQTYERENGPPLVTQAAHIFRCRPDAPRDAAGSVKRTAIEEVMTGGMANPVDVAFTPEGERIFTTTFFVKPAAGLRDGLVHAVRGGVYGQSRPHLDNHPRTGDLMPVLTHMGPAAPCGLMRYESAVFGREYQDNLFACQFNMHKVSRHVLEPNGAGLRTRDEDFLVCDHLDFHPTDVVEDADGSLIVVDTGGWYKICCPTSQLEKPDVLGAIYRVRRTGAAKVDDPRGLKLDWAKVDSRELAQRLADPRPAVVRRATEELAERGEDALPALQTVAKDPGAAPSTLRQIVWTLTRIDAPGARRFTRACLNSKNDSLCQSAIHAVGLWRDGAARDELIGILAERSPVLRRAAADALGRLRDPAATPAILAASADVDDRVLEHSLIFALLEIGNADATQPGLTAKSPHTRRASLIALDQIENGALQVTDVLPLLSDADPVLRSAAGWVVNRHLDWADSLAGYFRESLDSARPASTSSELSEELQARLSRFAPTPPVRALLAEEVNDPHTTTSARVVCLRAMAASGLKELPASWETALATLLQSPTAELLPEVVAVLKAVPPPKSQPGNIGKALVHAAADDAIGDDLRLAALSAVPGGLQSVDPALLELLAGRIDAQTPVATRAAAAEVLSKASLQPAQLKVIAAQVGDVSPLDIERILTAFSRSQDAEVGSVLVEALINSPVRSALREQVIREKLAKYPASVQAQLAKLYDLLRADQAEQRGVLESLATSMPAGDIRRGQEVFQSAKAACSSCHTVGYLGGHVGPDLTRIGKIRTQADLLESILFPSATLVMNFQPMTLLLIDGRAVNGLVLREDSDSLVLATGPNQELRVSREEIDSTHPSSVSIMPAGLDKQLSKQDLADLVEFLKSRQ